ncbi:MAG: hypothetical protein NUV53_02240 [Patescibacteria group bacterium]|nr:hypothetical protein [Patescibacteria group bacterium]
MHTMTIYERTLWIFAFVALMPWNSYAYIDPGTGSYLFQLFLGTVFGITVAFRSLRGKIMHIIVAPFRRRKDTHEDRKQKLESGNDRESPC